MHTDHLLRRAFADPALAPLWLRFLFRDHPLCGQIAWATLRVVPGASVDPKLKRHDSDLVLVANLKGSVRVVVFVIEFSVGPDSSPSSCCAAATACGDCVRLPRCPRRAYRPVSGQLGRLPCRRMHLRRLATEPGEESGPGRKRMAWRQLVRYCMQQIEKALRDDPGMPPPLVVPVLVHAGRRPFDGMLAVTTHPIDKALGRDLAGFSFAIALEDFAARSEAEVVAMPIPVALKLAALFAKFVRGRTPAEVEAALLRWSDMLRDACGGASDPDAAQVYATYVLETTQMPKEHFERVFREILGPDGDGPMKTTADLLREEGRVEGEARREARGRAEGEARGEARGRAELLRQLLRRRFGKLPAKASARLDACTIAQLDAIALRILDANSLDEVFVD